jgi:amino acid adenylation domain-containing protein
VAVVFGDETLTYAELDARANRLAHHLRALGVGPDVKVALFVERSPEMVVGLLGVLKAGGAYVPLDPGYPAERLAFMARDAQVRVLLTQERLLSELPEHGGRVVCLDRDWPLVARHPAHAPESGAEPEHLAYVIYTSGSTGTPKGSEVPHRAIPGFFRGVRYASFDAGQVHLQHSSPSWDALTLELWPALLTGARVVLLPARASEPALLGEQVRAHGVSILWLSAAYFNLIVDTFPEILAGVRQVMTGGEAVSPAHVRRAQALYPELRLVNGYGPSECTVFAACHPIPAGFDAPVAPIGAPIGDRRVYLVDARLEPAPPGVPGELCVGGPAVARGYLGRPGLTAEKFVPDPFSARPGARMYRTGDRARWRGDGTLEFVGRVDFQAKVRGFRVEPGEVEAALLADARVREAVVVVREDAPGDRRLVGYAVAAEGVELSAGELRAALKERLPDYLVPSAIVVLDALPLSAHGKVDRRALPAPEIGSDAEAYVAPRGATEEVLAALYAEVLGAARVGARDDFFALGGHSLIATRLVSRVREAFAVELPLRALFESPTVEALAAHVEALLREGRMAEAPPLVPASREGAPPLSFAQARLWFIDQLRPGSAAYNVPLALRLRGALDVAVLERALTEIVRRHEALRTTFAAAGDGEAVQVIHPPAPAAIAVEDLRGLSAAEREARARQIAADEAGRPFDLAAGPLLRASLLRLDDEEHALLFTLHHIVSDGWSMGVLAREVSELYGAFARGLPSPLPGLPVQYADFAVWQRAWLSGDVLDAQLGWWRERLAGAPPLLEIPTDRPRAAATGDRGASVAFSLPDETTRALRALSRREGATLFMTLLAGWQLLLSRYSGQDDVSVGTPIAGRTRLETEGLIGFFVNTLVLRADLSGSPTFGELLGRVREATLGAYQHQDVPFEKLVEELAPERSLSHTPFFQVMFVLQNNAREALRLGDVEAEGLGAGGETAKFDLTLALGETEEGVSGSLSYRAELFDAETVERMLGHFAALLGAVAADPDRSLPEIALVSADERARLLEWGAASDDAHAGVPGACVHELFAAQAAATPDAVAVVFGDETLTYAELDARANRLAHHLRGLGVGPDVKVALFVERSPEMVVGLLGVLKAGGAYVPLDPGYPAERLAFMARDAQVRVLLTQERLLSELPEHGGRVVCLDRDWPLVARHPSHAPESGAEPEHLAYVIYTSGSTGTPKGSEVPHRAVPGFFRGVAYASIDAGQVHLQHSSPSWDALTLELWPALLTGARVVLLPARASEPALLGEQVRAHGVSILWLSAAYFNLIVDTFPEILAGVRQVMTGGEAVSPAHVRRAQALYPELRLVNGYGPSECTVFAACHPIPAGFDAPVVPIGAPIGDRRVYLVDARLEPAPPGVPGELCVGGPAVARGYLGRPGLTAEKFVPDPFSARPGARMYRTGDRARWRGDGTLEFVGRVDFQAKVRGFRVEPGEVEAALLADARVREAVVVVREDAPGDRRLVGYAVPAEGVELSAGELRAALKERLPDYLVPSAILVLDALPLSAHGKVDRRALPAPEIGSDAEAYVAPRGATEEILAALYAEVLGAARVGARDDFFALGGHSLIATRLVSRVREAFAVELPLRALFESPTVEGLAGRVDALAREGRGLEAPPLVPAPREGALPLSFAQARLWFIDQLQPGSATYNMPYALRLRGRLDVSALERGLAALAARHEALRTRFPSVDGEPAQVVDPAGPVHLERVDLSHLSVGAREEAVRALAAAEAARPFDLAAGPLFRSTLARLGEDEHALVFVLHHIVTDGWSMGVLVREVSALYAAFGEGREPSLPDLPVQYADFAAWQRAWLSGGVLDAQLAFWRQALDGAPPLLEIPTDRPRPLVQGARGGHVAFTLSDETSRALRALSRREGATLFMTLLAGWQLFLSRYGGQDDVSVGTPIANRTRMETEGLIGFFVNTLVLRADLSGSPTFRELVRRARGTALAAYQHQDIPFEKLVEELAPDRSLSHTPLFQAMFALQNDQGEALRLGSLEAEALADGGEAAAKFDLFLGFGDGGGPLSGSLSHRAELWDAATMERMVEHLRALLDAVAAEPDRPAGEVSFLGEAERRRIVEEWNATDDAFDPDVLVHHRVSARARRTPDAVAVSFGGSALTYGEMETWSNRLAHRLRRLGVGPEARVGVCMERTPELLVAMLAVLKAGGAYVPLDPAHPAERLRWVLEDAGVRVLLARERLAGALPAEGITVVSVDADAERAAIAAESDALPGSGVGPENLAYVIYTSGSTGRPKGVQVEHRSVAALLHWIGRRVTDEEAASVLASTSATFDVSVAEVFGTLCRGGKLVLVGNALDLAAVPAGEEVRLGYMVPGAAAELLRMGALPASLRTLNLAGEALPAPLARDLHVAGVRPVNLYGPTEGTVYVTVAEVAPGAERVTIGRPVPNTRAYVVDARTAPVPVGVAGELCFGGAQVARGYLGRPALTAEKFVPDPFSTVPGARLYRTGDRVRWTAEGEIDYLGRMDFQVKVRGFRIELGEVEAVLREQPGVADAVVVAREDAQGERRLVAYLTSDGEAPDAAALRGALAARLPGYMVPSAFVALGAFPLTASGKLDRRALPAPEGAGAGAGYVAPRTEAERTVAEIWAEVLGVERVGVDDDFFALGGHSLRATRVVSQVRRALGAEVPVRTLFEAPTLGAFVAAVAQAAALPGGGAVPTILTRDRVEAALAEVDAIPEEELDRLLNELSTDEDAEW